MILGLSIPKFLGAILVGLILSGVLITLLVPHDEPSKVVTMPIKQTDMFTDISDLVVQLVQISVFLVIGGVVLSIMGGLMRAGEKY